MLELRPMVSTRTVAGVTASLLVALLTACGDDRTTGPEAMRLQIVSVAHVPGNGLTARVTLDAAGLDSVRIRYAGGSDGERTTPARRISADTVVLRVVGMRAETQYRLHAEGWRNGAAVAGDSATFDTDALPAALKDVAFSLTSGTPTSGYTLVPQLLGTEGYLVIFDSTGVIRWYLNTTPIAPATEPAHLAQLPNGNIVAYVGGTRGWDPLFGRFYEFDLDGQVVRTYGAAPPLYTDNHDLLIEFADTVPVATTYFSYDIRTTDVTPYGGAAGVALAGHQIIRQRLDGGTLFFWNAWDHFSLADWIEEPQSAKLGPTADFDHPNALARDLDGNYIVSWRAMGEISKIDSRTGEIIWRWGGRNNQFTFVNDPLGLFSGQHSVKVLPNGHVLMYDNGLRHQPPETRIAEYQLDQTAHTATLVWEYHHTPAFFTPFVGWTERLAGGNTFIGWGGVAVLQEVAPDKSTIWEARVLYQGNPSTFYRARRLPDLYLPRAP